jgi:hypothetical protein
MLLKIGVTDLIDALIRVRSNNEVFDYLSLFAILT